MEPEKGTFKIQTIGPKKEGTSKKGNAYKTYDLQFGGDANWYNTFWTKKEDPENGMELSGTKTYDEKFNSYKFEMEWGGGKNNWNPAAAQATVMSGAVALVAGFLAIPANYDLWTSDKPEDAKKLKLLFDKYVLTIETVSKRLKEAVVSMGSLTPEQKTIEKSASANSGDPGPTPPPNVEGWADGEEEINL